MSEPILVVEDVPNILELLDVTLRFKGYPVRTASNGEEALTIVPEDPPALVITDIMMPKMDGYTLAFNLRRNPETSQIPIDKRFDLELLHRIDFALFGCHVCRSLMP